MVDTKKSQRMKKQAKAVKRADSESSESDSQSTENCFGSKIQLDQELHSFTGSLLNDTKRLEVLDGLFVPNSSLWELSDSGERDREAREEER